jgi:zinc protease
MAYQFRFRNSVRHRARFPPNEAKALATRAWGAWRGADSQGTAIPAPKPPAKGQIVLVDKPDAAQTLVAQIYSAPQQKGDDYYDMRLVSEVLGANASGRLYANLRQAKGYSYVVASSLLVQAQGMAWLAQGAVQTDKTKESVVEFVKELRGIAGARPISNQELEDARSSLVRNYAAGFGTNLDVARRIAELWSRRWPMAELAHELEALQHASLATVQAAAKRYAVPADASLLLIGDRKKIEAPVRALKLGDVIVVDMEGKPVAGPTQQTEVPRHTR